MQANKQEYSETSTGIVSFPYIIKCIKRNNKLVTVHENYGNIDLSKIIDDLIERNHIEHVLEMDHEYRMKQLDVDIAMVDVKKLELQIELLKLQKGLQVVSIFFCRIIDYPKKQKSY